MKPEQLMWNHLSAVLTTFAIAQRHEDKYSPDVPDVSFVRRSDGVTVWVELKTIDKWSPAVTKVPHLRAGQVNWLKSRSNLGAPVFMLLWIRESNEWLWIPGKELLHSMIDIGLDRETWLSLSDAQPF